jgi:hypothetical protein
LALLSLVGSVKYETGAFISSNGFKPLKVLGAHNNSILSGGFATSPENDEIGPVLGRGYFPLVVVNCLDRIFNDNLPVIESEWVRVHSNRMLLRFSYCQRTL